MRKIFMTWVIGSVVAGTSLVALAQVPSPSQDEESVPTQAAALATVRIPQAVQADATRLAAGTYRVRLTGKSVEPVAGETPNLEQWVEFLQGNTVRGTAVASIVPGDRIREVAESRPPANGTARVERLKSGDYLRIWIRKGTNNYLIHLPVATNG